MEFKATGLIFIEYLIISFLITAMGRAVITNRLARNKERI